MRPIGLALFLAALTASTAGARDMRVIVDRANVRAEPDQESPMLWRVVCGDVVALVAERGRWREVADPASGRRGFVRADLLGPATREAACPTLGGGAPRSRGPAALPRQPPVERAARASGPRAPLVGRCLCPYDLDRAGRRCGARSAYSRPGGARPVCF